LSSPTVVAIGINPEEAAVEIMIRTADGEQRKKMPLKNEHRLYFDLLKNAVGAYL